jgi:hypothetical protein
MSTSIDFCKCEDSLLYRSDNEQATTQPCALSLQSLSTTTVQGQHVPFAIVLLILGFCIAVALFLSH